MTESPLQRQLRLKREARAAAEPTPDSSFDDVIPSQETSYEKTPEQMTVDRLIDSIDVLDAYRRWIPKEVPRQRSSKREGVMVRCPVPGHTDTHPSAWINRDKGVWHCAGCERGGDVLDLAAFHFGYGDDYKAGRNFVELRNRIAEDYGYTFFTGPGIETPILVAPAAVERADLQASDVEARPEAPAEQAPAQVDSIPGLEDLEHEPAPAAPRPVRPVGPVRVVSPAAGGLVPVGPKGGSSSDDGQSDGLAPVIGTIGPVEDHPDDSDFPDDLPALDWRRYVTPGTFLDSYMAAACLDDVPEEYHFWNAILALGVAIGRDVVLSDFKPVLGNLFVCILGRTGSGKSRASGYISDLMQDAFPYDKEDPMSRGAKHITTPGSAESLIQQFSRPIYDATTAKLVVGHAPVRGVVNFSELSSLTGRTSRAGSVLKPALMQFFDGERLISSSSLTNGTNESHDSFASILTSTQPKALKELVSQQDADSGFINRWLFVTGEYKKREAVGGHVVDARSAAPKLRAIWDWAFDKNSGVGLGGWRMPWSENALKMFKEFFDTVLEPTQKVDDTGLLVRIDLMCKKLILLFSANEMLDEVSEDVVRRVIELYDYLLAVVQIPGAHVGVTQQSDLEMKIKSLIQRNAGNRSKTNPTGSPLGHILEVCTRNKGVTREMVVRALDILAKTKEIEAMAPEPSSTVGRKPSVRYQLVHNE